MAINSLDGSKDKKEPSLTNEGSRNLERSTEVVVKCTRLLERVPVQENFLW